MRISISVFGEDKPGIIAELTRVINEAGGNIEDASMTLLQGNFAMIMVVEIGDDQIEELHNAFTSSKMLSELTKSIVENVIKDEYSNFGESVRYIFQLSVNDSPGIVAGVTSVLSRHQGNIVDCRTRKNNQTDVFTMVLDVDVPKSNENSLISDINETVTKLAGDVIFQRVDDIDF